MRLGREPDHARRACRRSSGRRSRTKTGRWCRTIAFLSYWPTRLWDFNKHYQYIGAQGAYGIGYGAPAAVGAALANKKHGRLTVNIQCDGDLNYAPGVLWTAAHHRIPLLTIMHNNRALSSGADVRPGHGGPRGARHRPGRHRHRDHRSQHRLRDDGEGVRRVQRRTDRTIRRTWGRRSGAPSTSSSAASPRSIDVVTQPR